MKYQKKFFSLVSLIGVLLISLLNLWAAGYKCRPILCEWEARIVCDNLCNMYGRECLDARLLSTWCSGSYCYSGYSLQCEGMLPRGYVCSEYDPECGETI